MDEIDPQILRDLNDALSQLTGTVRSVTPALTTIVEKNFTDELKNLKPWQKQRLEAEKKAAKQAEESTKKEKTLEQRQQEEYERQLESLGYRKDSTGKLESTQVELTEQQYEELRVRKKEYEKRKLVERAMIDPIHELKNHANQVKDLTGVWNDYKEKQFEQVRGSIDEQKKAVSILMLKFAAFEGLSKAITGMGKSLWEGEKGAKVGAKAISDLVDPLSTALYGIGAMMLFFPGGWVFKALGVAATGAAVALQGFAKAAEAGAEYNDKVYETFNNLSQVGLTTAQGMTGVSNTMEKLSVPIQGIQEFSNLLKNNSKDLALLGGRGAKGVEKFADVASSIVDPAGELNKKLLLLGYSSDNQREFTLKYLANETRAGRIANKDRDDLIKGSVAYMEELDRIAELTGITREEQQKAREAVLKIDELRAAQFIAEQQGDKERVAELKAAEALATKAMAEGRKEYALGISQFYAAGKGGRVVGAESAAFAQQEKTRAKIAEKAAAEARGEQGPSETEIYVTSMEDIKAIMTKVASARKLGVTDLAGLGLVDSFAKQADLVARTSQALKEAGGDVKKLEDILQENQKKRTEGADKLTKVNAELTQIQTKTQLNLTAVARKFDGAGLAMANAVDAFNKSVELLSGKRATTATPSAKPGGQDISRSAQNLSQAEAKNILENGSERDIAAFGGREFLTQRAKEPADKTPESTNLSGLTTPKTKDTTTPATTNKPAITPVAPTTTPTTVPQAPTTSNRPAITPVAPTTNISIADEPVTPNNPLSARQMAVIGMSLRSGNTYPDFVMEKYNKQRAQNAAPVGSNSSENTTPNKPDIQSALDKTVPKARDGGIFTGPGMSAGPLASEVLSSLQNNVNSVKSQPIKNELPELDDLNVAQITTSRSTNVAAFEILGNFTKIIEEKFNDLIDQVSTNNGIRSEILDYSRI